MRGETAAPQPVRPLYVIGDIHGRADLLQSLLQGITEDAACRGGGAAKSIFLGDYIDRGDDAHMVLDLLFYHQRRSPEGVICLMGNHERMMLDFLDRPEEGGKRWLRHGGEQTLTSFGLQTGATPTSPEAYAALAMRLRAALPGGLETWLRTLPLWHRSGDVVCVHAAMDPASAPEKQDERTLLWDCRSFHTRPRKDGLWVVHGHSIVQDATINGRRISIDTGAYFSDRLTAAVIFPGQPVRFVQTGD